ncbi:hypothetical protein BSZ39_03315 [Bowdeniella nasicola]|uniref:Uncharacterized protein n=1 Tax=Bowdeniella nasicola TaxID=208480 RepID=A0A1Q5Q4L2_9ACTO|nr:hypothetical protein BSZ39_03315 [Bowdeniella nasicola]
MVADDERVVADEVEGRSHRMLVEAELVLLHGQVGQRRALDGVAIVDHQDGIRALRGSALGLNDGIDAGEAQFLTFGVGCVSEVIPVHDVAMDVGRRQKIQLDGVPGCGAGGHDGRCGECRSSEGSRDNA